MHTIEITTEEYTRLVRADMALKILREVYNKDETFAFGSVAKSLLKKEVGEE